MKSLCKIAGFSTQAYYKRFKSEQDKQARHVVLRELVDEVREYEPFCGGRKLLHRISNGYESHGYSIGRDKFFEFLREEDLLVKYKHRSTNTTYSKHNYAVAPNLVKDMEIGSVNQVFVSDITYLRLKGAKFAYLFLVTDAYSRKIVGWYLSDNLGHQAAVKALRMAVANLDDPTGIIHHSDRGVQYCCHGYLEELKKNNMLASMTDASHCYQNAIAERINGILKMEFMLGSTFSSIQQATAATMSAINIYNNKRTHLSLGLKTPAAVYGSVSRIKYGFLRYHGIS